MIHRYLKRYLVPVPGTRYRYTWSLISLQNVNLKKMVVMLLCFRYRCNYDRYCLPVSYQCRLPVPLSRFVARHCFDSQYNNKKMPTNDTIDPLFTSTSPRKPSLLTISFADDPSGLLGLRLRNRDLVSWSGSVFFCVCGLDWIGNWILHFFFWKWLISTKISLITYSLLRPPAFREKLQTSSSHPTLQF